MVLGDQGVFDELFSYACPKFITASPPDYDAPSANTNQEAYRLQLKMFLALLHQQRSLPGLKQLLKLYTVRFHRHADVLFFPAAFPVRLALCDQAAALAVRVFSLELLYRSVQQAACTRNHQCTSDRR